MNNFKGCCGISLFSYYPYSQQAFKKLSIDNQFFFNNVITMENEKYRGGKDQSIAD